MKNSESLSEERILEILGDMTPDEYVRMMAANLFDSYQDNIESINMFLLEDDIEGAKAQQEEAAYNLRGHILFSIVDIFIKHCDNFDLELDL